MHQRLTLFLPPPYHTVPIPTYFCCETSVRSADLAPLAVDGGALCPNLFYLGGTSGVKQIGGLTVAFLAQESTAACETLAALAEARSAPPSSIGGSGGAGGIDVLLTNTVPRGVATGTAPAAAAALAEAARVTSTAARDAARALRPRYHFAGGAGAYWVRAPYRNEPWARTRTGSQHFFTTRFYALAPVANPAHERYLFAAAVRPISTMQHEDMPPDTTDSPYRFASSSGAGAGERPAKRPRGERPDHQQQGQKYFLHQSDACWFCLGNPAAETHLMAHVGAQCYVTVAKGPVCAGHVLVVPCAHVPSTAALAPDARAETLRTVRAVVRALLAPDGPFRARAVAVFERHIPRTIADRRGGGGAREIYAHGYIHIVPLPHDSSTAGDAEALANAFETAGAKVGAHFEAENWMQPRAAAAAAAQPEAFFWYRVVAAGDEALETDDSAAFPVRGAAALESRCDWHRCVTSREDEERMTRLCRDALTPFLPPEDDDEENEDEDEEEGEKQ